jgi:hypothetical protein
MAANNISNLQAAMVGEHRYLVYQNATSETSSGIFFQESHDDGVTFSHPRDISNNTHVDGVLVQLDSKNPNVGAFGDKVYVIWEGKRTTGNTNLFYTNSSDGGATFENATDASENRAVNIVESSLIVDPATGKVFVAYVNDDGSVVPCHVHCDDD